MIVLDTLGPVRVRVGEAPAPRRLLWRKNLALLVYLACSPRKVRSREHLVGLLWGDKPEDAARHSLNEAVRVLRRAAGDGTVDSAGGHLRLDGVDCDLDRFDALVGAGRWAEAAQLVQGDFLEGFSVPGASEFEDWIAAERAARRQQCVEALVNAAEQALSGGEVQEAGALARRATALDPLSEIAARTAMRAAALAGDRGSAIEHYERLARDLSSAVSAAPDARTAALAERIRSDRLESAGTPGAGGTPRRAPLAGRTAELARLVAVWQSVRNARRAALLVVEAESGMGKSRLVEELAIRAGLDGALRVVVRAVEGDTESSWAGAFALARGGLLDARGLAAAAPDALAAFATVLPEWGDRFPAARTIAPQPLGRALGEIVRAIAEQQPCLLVIDDAQWLDRESLLSLLALLRDLPQLPFALALTLALRPPRAELDDARTRIGRDLEGVVVRLDPFGEEAIRQLAQWAMPAVAPDQLDRVARRVLADSAGVPLLAFELVHAIALGLDPDPRSAWPSPFRTLDETLPGDLPDVVVAAIRVGFRRLEPDAQTVLCAAAVLGSRLEPETLAAAADLPADRATRALDQLEWERWLEADARGYTFAARIMREVVARDMVTPGQRRRIESRARAPA